MLLIKCIEGEIDVTMAGKLSELIADLMSSNRVFYNALKERDEVLAEVFKNFMLENVSTIFEDNSQDDDTVENDKLDKLLDKAQELIDKLREQK